ncbi:MAG: UDP-N-acetylmuramoyl-L-alanine--D-glutamate ligase [Phycisphaera sp.]|nr:UDP-N-acetylmuramoyl-L-alanine--D-glutamate ligase [Phycisphaera sp.]
MHDLNGKRVVVMGLGRFGGGVGVTRFAHARGASVLVTDLLNASQLTDSLARLADLPDVEYYLGGHRLADFTAADVVVINPAVDLRDNTYLIEAEAHGAELTTEIQLLIERVNRMRVIGVTGTAGKSTTVAMIGHALAATCGPDRVHVGGNIGGSLLGALDAIADDHWIVLELSSFMLDLINDWSPHIAIVTNIADNHLDRHGTMADYAAAKQQLLRDQVAGDHAVLGESVASWAALTPARVTVIDRLYKGAMAIPGAHNRLNALFAQAAWEIATGVDMSAFHDAIATFAGLPHRLQLVAEHNGVTFFNDSKSTTPESAKLAIDAFEPGVVHAILGGYDKHADLQPLAEHAAKRCAAVYAIGQTGPTIAGLARQVADHCPVHGCADVDAAVKQAVAASRNHAGQVVLLSPGCASWDQFTNYEARGRAFAEAVLRFTDEE